MTSTTTKKPKYLTLQAVCKLLEISEATGRNWLRLGKITPIVTKDNSKDV